MLNQEHEIDLNGSPNRKVSRGEDIYLNSPTILMQAAAIILTSVGAAIIYGIIHDQITARICIEYFTIGHPPLIESNSPTVIGLFWGFAGTWWLGLTLGIGLAIVARAGKRPKLTWHHLIRPIRMLLCYMFLIAFVGGAIGYLSSRSGIFVLVEPLASRVPANKHVAFLTAGWTHAASYLAGLIGGITFWILTWKRRLK